MEGVERVARFRFRLEVSLRLAKWALEEAQKVFAREFQLWQELVEACVIQQKILEAALDGQREASWLHPEDLGLWQVYAEEQLRRLRKKETERDFQKEVMEEARQKLLEAHREVEKFSRLKEKRRRAFEWAEAKKEQSLIDETGQVLYWRQQNIEMTEVKVL